MAERPYDENEERKRYIWRHFPDAVRPHECIPHPDAVEAALPEHHREAFRRYYNAIGSSDSPAPLPPDLESLVTRIQADIETASLDAAVGDREFDIHRCAQCNRILQSPSAQQCLWCGHDWH
ncbi:hypothetical protein CA13_31370 [Planctomycetes bacterium CA13]|uniref:Uncharacterized protein n=1 Tax=Novipirellula herctigrandis TaxID=2527986 RepID=A0A5C5YKV3_9BACT|nr:hypothetical protein CA13_73900 [Planctomycetes bacterium CA13]TWT81684.1 hypothetical protein CA13_31370 [Planctomycetes bacterium CA13]